MPLYEYVCPNGHKHTRLRSYDERNTPAECLVCDELCKPIISAPHVGPDGMYSYAHNVGSKDKFDRKQAKIEHWNEQKKDGKKPKLIDEI